MSDKRTWQITIEVEATRTQAQALFGEIADWAHGEPYRLPDIDDWSPAVSLGPLDALDADVLDRWEEQPIPHPSGFPIGGWVSNRPHGTTPKRVEITVRKLA